MKTIVLATKNRDKVREIQAKIGLQVKLLTLHDIPDMPDVVEDSETLEGNAVKKSLEIYEYTGIPALADDTGLSVDALNGAPGVYSARYAGVNASYDDNVNKLLDEMLAVDEEQRGAEFRTVMAYTDGDGTLTAVGATRGRITMDKRGLGGFGYDPVFLPEASELTYSQLDLAEKNRISHRGKAVSAIISLLKDNKKL